MSFLVPLEILLAIPDAAKPNNSPQNENRYLPGPAELKKAFYNDPDYVKKCITDRIMPLLEGTNRELADKAIRKESSITGFQKLPSLGFTDPLAKSLEEIRFFDFKLFNNDIKRGYEIAADYIDNGILPPNNWANGKRVIRELRQLEGCLIRLNAAQNTADITGIELSKVLALFRVEGDLIAPDTESAIESGLSSIETTFEYEISFNPKANMRRGTWLWEKTVFFKYSDTLDQDKIRVFIMAYWMMIIPGFDKGLQAILSTNSIPDVDTARTSFAIFSNRNWAAAGNPSSYVEAESRFDIIYNNLTCSVIKTPGKGDVYRSNPIDAVALLSNILTEALMYHLALLNDHTEFGGLEYLIYHQMEPGSLADPRIEAIRIAKNKFYKLLVSAFVAAKKTSDPRYEPLRTAIAGIDLPSNIIKSSEFPDLFTKIFSSLPSGFDFELIIDFINTADCTVWKSWQVPRANNFRYLQLVNYYKKLLA